MKTLLTGIALGESPRWHDGRLWFSDWGAQEIIAVDLSGRSEVMLRVPAMPFCFDWLPDGRLLVLSGDGMLQRREPDGTLVTHADLTGLARTPWNEIVVDGLGNAYVNNIGFDFPDGEYTTGIVAFVPLSGDARQVADDVAFPNGMAITPDGGTLIVAESYAGRLTAYDIGPGGDLSGRRVWAAVDKSAPDGICLDAEGAVWYGDVPNQRCVRVREGGEVLDAVELDRGCFACALNDHTLFLVAAQWPPPGAERTGVLLTVEAPAPAAAPPRAPA